MSKHLLIRLVALLAAFVLIATACGGDDDDAATGDDGVTTAEDDGGEEEIPTPTPSGDVDNTDLSAKPLVEVPAGDPPAELTITDVVEGGGAVAASGDFLIMEYVGVAYSDGLQFDASWDRGQPFTFTLGQGQVISGWDEGIEGMAVGGRRELVIPPDMAYGEGGSGTGAIGPNETLIFMVDLVGVVAADATKPEVDVPAEPLEAVGARPEVEVPVSLDVVVVVVTVPVSSEVEVEVASAEPLKAGLSRVHALALRYATPSTANPMCRAQATVATTVTASTVEDSLY